MHGWFAGERTACRHSTRDRTLKRARSRSQGRHGTSETLLNEGCAARGAGTEEESCWPNLTPLEDSTAPYPGDGRPRLPSRHQL